jgi:hypothetical protein
MTFFLKRAILTVATLLVCGISAQAASGKWSEISRKEAERIVGADYQYVSQASMWIWTNRIVYQAGESVVLRGTLKTNGDLYPYTTVAYRVNNQTGVRVFLPAGGGEATDLFGNTYDQGFSIRTLPEWSKQILLGEGGLVGGTAARVPDEPGMHTYVVELRDYTGTRVLKAAYAKISVVTGFEDLQGPITANRTLRNTIGYRLRGVVPVRNSVLTIEPGTVIQGQPGSQPPSVLLITRTGRLEARGTRSRPIIMTSAQLPGQRRKGDWGGLILLGAARTNATADRNFIEGLDQSDDTRFGGDDDAHNCGTLRYVRVEFAGAVLNANNEVNGITWGGCGTGTVSEYLQAHYGFDDAFEWFGGINDARNLVATYAGDDNIDVQYGYRGRIQNVVILQNAERGNRGIEADNYEFNFTAQPVGTPKMWNFTMIGSGLPGLDESSSPGIFLRRGAAGTYNNMIVMNFATNGIQFDNPETLANIDNNSLTANGILLWNNGPRTNNQFNNTLAGQVHSGILSFAQGQRGLGRNFVVTDPMLRRPFEFSDPDFRPLPNSPVCRATWVVPPDEFFDTDNCLGAFGPDVDWTREWVNWLQEPDLQ